jgi:predicted nucleic acid-binding protein
MRTLVDTSVWIDWLNARESAETDWLRRAIKIGHPIIIPGLVLTEVLRGVAGEPEARRLERMLSQFDPPPALDETDYRDAARLYRECRSKGVTIASTVDCLIAQLAIRHGLKLLTCDRDFAAIAHVAPLRLMHGPAH